MKKNAFVKWGLGIFLVMSIIIIILTTIENAKLAKTAEKYPFTETEDGEPFSVDNQPSNRYILKTTRTVETNTETGGTGTNDVYYNEKGEQLSVDTLVKTPEEESNDYLLPDGSVVVTQWMRDPEKTYYNIYAAIRPEGGGVGVTETVFTDNIFDYTGEKIISCSESGILSFSDGTSIELPQNEENEHSWRIDEVTKNYITFERDIRHDNLYGVLNLQGNRNFHLSEDNFVHMDSDGAYYEEKNGILYCVIDNQRNIFWDCSALAEECFIRFHYDLEAKEWQAWLQKKDKKHYEAIKRMNGSFIIEWVGENIIKVKDGYYEVADVETRDKSLYTKDGKLLLDGYDSFTYILIVNEDNDTFFVTTKGNLHLIDKDLNILQDFGRLEGFNYNLNKMFVRNGRKASIVDSDGNITNVSHLGLSAAYHWNYYSSTTRLYEKRLFAFFLDGNEDVAVFQGVCELKDSTGKKQYYAILFDENGKVVANPIEDAPIKPSSSTNDRMWLSTEVLY